VTRYIALVRAVNVGGAGKLPMSELAALCGRCGFSRISTVLASGNVLFDAAVSADACAAALQAGLHAHMGGPASVQIRTSAALARILEANPFKDRPPNRVLVTFLGEPPAKILEGVAGRGDEEIISNDREIYVYYPSGQGASRLKLPSAQAGTARNINTIAKLEHLARNG
jgi:uncharacterized protein (DUF1697 family)